MLKISDVEPATALNGLFTNGSVAGGISPTRLVAAFFNAVQTELVNIVETSGMQLDKDDPTQVLKALHLLFLQRAEPFADIKSDGAVAVSKALANLGLNRIEQTPLETRVKSPSGGSYIVVDDSKWGCWVDGVGPLALSVAYGGTGAKNAADALANFGIGPIASTAEIKSGTAEKLVDAAGLIGAIATDADIQNRVARKLVDAVGLINAIATRDEIDSGATRKLVSGAGLINSIATDADIQNKVPRKLVDSYGLVNAISTMQDIQDGALRKFVNALTLKNYLPVKALAGNGFIRIPDVPGGTIIQYGQVSKSISEGVQNVTLPTPFPNSCRFAIAIPLNTGASAGIDIFAQLQSLSQTGINFYFSWATSSTPADGFQWFAIGY